jgi:type II secretory pathway component PulF
MSKAKVFPPMVVQMTAVGEETGALDQMLNKVSAYYDVEVDYAIRNLSTAIEPILLVFIGGAILFLALGIFLPMWDMINVLKR